jgi:hypothetical protein
MTVKRRSTIQKQKPHIMFQELRMETVKRQVYSSGSLWEVWGWLKTPYWDWTQEYSIFKKKNARFRLSSAKSYQTLSFVTNLEGSKRNKGKVQPRTGHEDPEGKQSYSSTLPLNSALDCGGWPTSRPSRFAPGKETRHPCTGGVRWAPGSVWTGAENLASNGIRPRTVQLRHAGPWVGNTDSKICL